MSGTDPADTAWKKKVPMSLSLAEYEEKLEAAYQRGLREGRKEAAAIIADHYWDSMGAIGKAHGDALVRMILGSTP